MEGLSARQVLDAWERGSRMDPALRCLALLETGSDAGVARPTWAQAPLGERDARLLALRAATIGPVLSCRTSCPSCGTGLEFELEIDALLSRGAAEAPDEFEYDGWRLRVRPVTSDDVRALRHHVDATAARQALLRRTVTVLETPTGHREANASVATIDDAPPEILAVAARQVETIDPGADRSLELSCASCDERWTDRIDVGAFVWREFTALAQRLLCEVHELACAYGWSESAILGLSPARRQAYLELLAPGAPGEDVP